MEKNVKERLLNARKEIAETKVKKEGKNTFSKYEYYTPSQITALVTKACISNGLITNFSISKVDDNYIGTLVVQSISSDDVLEFTIPTAMPDIKATNITQKLGGMVTYTQRYLEMVAFCITDNNLDLDSQDNRGVKEKLITNENFDKGLEKHGKEKVKEMLKGYTLTAEQKAKL